MEKIKKSFKQLGIWNTLLKMLFFASPLVPACWQGKTILWKYTCVAYLRKYIKCELEQDNYVKKVEQDSKVIWVLWLQGEVNMPSIVRICYNSIKKFAGERKVILLTEDNLSDYIDVPQSVMDLYKNNRMQAAQYSDFIRAQLMYTYGGIWMDATVLLTGPIDEDIEKAHFFMFQKSQLETAVLPVSTWFIATDKPGGYMSKRMLASLENYWRHESHLRDNFIFHLIIAVLLEYDKKFREEFLRMPYKCNVNPHLLYFDFDKEYSPQEWSYIKRMSNIHKLSWKIQGEPRKNSFLHKLLQGILSDV